MPPAPISASPSPTNCRSSASPATLGTEALGFTNLFTPATAVWSIAGGITQTLFDAGTLLHKKRAAAAALDQAAAQYRSTVIKAFQNVADALRALQFDADTLHEQAAAEQAAVRQPGAGARAVPGSARISYLDSAERRPHLAAGAAVSLVQARSGPLRRHRRAVPGAGRRLVAPHRRRRRMPIGPDHLSRHSPQHCSTDGDATMIRRMIVMLVACSASCWAATSASSSSRRR